jgi:choline dehydrogenase-like flavoprotein
LVRAGFHPFHNPCGILLDEANPPFSACVRCQDCDGFPCAVLAKSDAETIAVRPALAYPNLTLRTGAHVTRLLTNASGRVVTGVVVEADGETQTLAADLVVVSCGAANTAKLLLASANDRHPNGLANGSDCVGRHYVFHNSQGVIAVSREPNPTRYQKTLGVNDFYFGADDSDVPLGNIQMLGKSQGPMYRSEKPHETSVVPGWTLDMVARHAVDFWLTTEDLPLPQNRVTLERDGRIKLDYTPTNEAPKRMLYAHLKAMLDALGMHPEHLIPRNLYLQTDVGLAAVAHQAGTARFGRDPKTSVLDTTCKAHELDNLYVVDTSFMPSIGAVNPGLTTMANALRVADALLDRLGVREQTRNAGAPGTALGLSQRVTHVAEAAAR